VTCHGNVGPFIAYMTVVMGIRLVSFIFCMILLAETLIDAEKHFALGL